MPRWWPPLGHSIALVQGLAAGVALPVLALLPLLVVGDRAGPLVLYIMLGPPALVLPAAFVDLLAAREARTNAALTGATLLALPGLLVLWPILLEWPLGEPLAEWRAMAFVPSLAWLVAAERCNAHGWLAWRDRSVGLAAGMFLGLWSMAEPWLAVAGWLPLVGALGLDLPRSGRLVLVVLAGVQALALGQLFADVDVGRAVEAAVFVAYAAASAVALRRSTSRHRQRHRPLTATPA